MKMRLSHKDLILLLGILVAVVIAFTAWVYSSDAMQAKVPSPFKKEVATASSMIRSKLKGKTTAPIQRVR